MSGALAIFGQSLTVAVESRVSAELFAEPNPCERVRRMTQAQIATLLSGRACRIASYIVPYWMPSEPSQRRYARPSRSVR